MAMRFGSMLPIIRFLTVWKASQSYKEVATDITASKLENSIYEGKINAIQRSQAVIEFELDGDPKRQ